MTIIARIEAALLTVLRRLSCRLADDHTPSGAPIYSTTIAQWYNCAICGKGFWRL